MKVVNILATVRDKSGEVIADLGQEGFPLGGQPGDALAFVATETRRQLQIRGGGGTLLYDAVVQASDEVMRKLTGRKALIVLSDGVDFGSDGSSRMPWQRPNGPRPSSIPSSIPIPVLGFLGGHDGRRVLQRPASESGGSFLGVSKKRSLDDIFEFCNRNCAAHIASGLFPTSRSRFPSFERFN